MWSTWVLIDLYQVNMMSDIRICACPPCANPCRHSIDAVVYSTNQVAVQVYIIQHNLKSAQEANFLISIKHSQQWDVWKKVWPICCLNKYFIMYQRSQRSRIVQSEEKSQGWVIVNGQNAWEESVLFLSFTTFLIFMIKSVHHTKVKM